MHSFDWRAGGLEVGDPWLLLMFRVAPHLLTTARAALDADLQRVELCGEGEAVWYYGLGPHELYAFVPTEHFCRMGQLAHVAGVKKHEGCALFEWRQGRSPVLEQALSREQSPPMMGLWHCKLENHLVLQYGRLLDEIVAKTVLNADGPCWEFVLGGLGWNEVTHVALCDGPACLIGGPEEGDKVAPLRRLSIVKLSEAAGVKLPEPPWYGDQTLTAVSSSLPLIGIRSDVVEEDRWDVIHGPMPPARLSARARAGHEPLAAQAMSAFCEAIDAPQDQCLREFSVTNMTLQLPEDTGASASARVLSQYLAQMSGEPPEAGHLGRHVYEASLAVIGPPEQDLARSIPNCHPDLANLAVAPPENYLHKKRREGADTHCGSIETLYRLYNRMAQNHQLYHYAIPLHGVLTRFRDALDEAALSSKDELSALPPLEERLQEDIEQLEAVLSLHYAHSYSLGSRVTELPMDHLPGAQRLLLALSGISSLAIRGGDLLPEEDRDMAWVVWSLQHSDWPHVFHGFIAGGFATLSSTLLFEPERRLAVIGHEPGHVVAKRSKWLYDLKRRALSHLDDEVMEVASLFGTYFSPVQDQLLDLFSKFRDIFVVHGLEQVFCDSLALRTVFHDDLEAMFDTFSREIGHGHIGGGQIPFVGRAFYCHFLDASLKPESELDLDQLSEREGIGEAWTKFHLRVFSETKWKPLQDEVRRTESNSRVPEIDRYDAWPWWLQRAFAAGAAHMLAFIQDRARSWAGQPESEVEAAIYDGTRALADIRTGYDENTVHEPDQPYSAFRQRVDALLDCYHGAAVALGRHWQSLK